MAFCPLVLLCSRGVPRRIGAARMVVHGYFLTPASQSNATLIVFDSGCSMNWLNRIREPSLVTAKIRDTRVKGGGFTAKRGTAEPNSPRARSTGTDQRRW